MFYFNLFGMEAVFDERKNTLTYGGETITIQQVKIMNI